MFSQHAVSEASHPSSLSHRSRSCGLRWGVAGVLLAAILTTCSIATDEPAPPPDALTIDQAAQIALANNRNLKIVALSLDSSKEKLAAEKTRRLPSFNTYIFGSQVLTPFSFTVQAGQFGTYPATGPIPATNTNITTPAQFTAYIFGTASQPLLTLYKMNIHIHGKQLSVEQAAQKVREERISIVDDVRQAYYSIVEIQNAIEATAAKEHVVTSGTNMIKNGQQVRVIP